MARSWAPPKDARIAQATIGAIVRWRKVDNDAQYQGSIRRDAWETVLPEIAFEG
jgi:ATP-dependent DNA helicase RecQ